jgi:hypothetical protein
MLTTLTLQADGFEATWNFLSYNQIDKVFKVSAEISLLGTRPQKLIEEVIHYLFVQDLERLIIYFEQFIMSGTDGLLQDTYPYVPLELGFQLQALSGETEFDEVTNEVDGYYSLRVMLKTQNASHQSVYVGAESTISIFETRKFVEALKVILSIT